VASNQPAAGLRADDRAVGVEAAETYRQRFRSDAKSPNKNKSTKAFPGEKDETELMTLKA
jgi:hypothetical protein